MKALKPYLYNHASYYGKALTSYDGKKLYSYGKLVCEIIDTRAIVHDARSLTTRKHINEFLYQNNYEWGSRKYLEKTYPVEEIW